MPRGLLSILLAVLCVPLLAGTTLKRGPGGSAAGTECRILPALDINCTGTEPSPATSGCDLQSFSGVGGAFTYWAAGFNGAAEDSFGAWNISVPDNFTGTTMTARSWWTNGGDCNTAPDVACMVLDVASGGDMEDFAAPIFGTSVGSLQACTGMDEMTIGEWGEITHGWTAGDRTVIRIHRDIDGGHADCGQDDDVEGQVRLLGIEICYEVDQPLAGE